MGRRGGGRGRTPKKLVPLAAPGTTAAAVASPGAAESPWQQPLRVSPGAGIVWTPETPQRAGGGAGGYAAFGVAPAGALSPGDEGLPPLVPGTPYEDACSEYGNATDEGSPGSADGDDVDVKMPKAGGGRGVAMHQPLLEDEGQTEADVEGGEAPPPTWCSACPSPLVSLFFKA